MMREQCNSSRLIFKSDIGTWDNSLGWETNSHGWEPRKQSNHSQLNFVFQTILMVASFVWCTHYLSGVHECHAWVIRMTNNGDPCTGVYRCTGVQECIGLQECHASVIRMMNNGDPCTGVYRSTGVYRCTGVSCLGH